jgi:hypothetical protein
LGAEQAEQQVHIPGNVLGKKFHTFGHLEAGDANSNLIESA